MLGKRNQKQLKNKLEPKTYPGDKSQRQNPLKISQNKTHRHK
jgi:hypothetical protein